MYEGKLTKMSHRASGEMVIEASDSGSVIVVGRITIKYFNRQRGIFTGIVSVRNQNYFIHFCLIIFLLCF